MLGKYAVDFPNIYIVTGARSDECQPCRRIFIAGLQFDVKSHRKNLSLKRKIMAVSFEDINVQYE